MPIAAARLPIMDPCPVSVELQGRGATQWCDRCERVVHDLSSMREVDVRRLLSRHVGQKICVSYVRRPDGTVRTQPEPAPGWIVAAALASGCASRGPAPSEPPALVAVASDASHETATVDDAQVAAPAPTPMVRVDFAVDPRATLGRGGLLVLDEWTRPNGRLRFVSTRELILNARARWRERGLGPRPACR